MMGAGMTAGIAGMTAGIAGMAWVRCENGVGSYDIVATRTPTPTPPPTMTPTRTPVPTSTATATPSPIPPDELPRAGGPGISGGLLLMLALAGGLLLAAGSVILRARTAGETS